GRWRRSRSCWSGARSGAAPSISTSSSRRAASIPRTCACSPVSTRPRKSSPRWSNSTADRSRRYGKVPSTVPRKESVMTKVKYLLALLAVATATLVAVVVLADARAAEKEKAMGLRLVMQELGRDMQAVTGAISREDWAMVAKLAPEIGRHAQPPAMEKMRIIKWVGKDAGQFRALDARVGQAADDMAAAASRGDGA